MKADEPASHEYATGKPSSLDRQAEECWHAKSDMTFAQNSKWEIWASRGTKALVWYGCFTPSAINGVS